MTISVFYWRRTDLQALERLELTTTFEAIKASSVLISLEGGGYRLEHDWYLDQNWSVQSAQLIRWGKAGKDTLRLDRSEAGWHVNGLARPDLDGAAEPDLSATPFCNSFAIHRASRTPGEILLLDTAYIDASTLTVTRSRQRYEWHARDKLNYFDLGLFDGFSAKLTIDASGLVETYENLFERVISAEALQDPLSASR